MSCCVFSALPVSAATAKEQSGYNQKTKLKNPDDFSWDNASVYFLLTDRFCNGNTSNDHSYGRATNSSGQPLSGWDTAPGTFHGGDFAGITKKINEGYFDKLGVDAIWLSAPYEQIHGYVDSGAGFAHYSYHGYYVLDYTETDANFGTKQEFKTMVDSAHKHGIRIVMDIVMNHAGYNTVKDMETYNYGTLPPGFDAPYIYYWNSATLKSEAAWPGKPMKKFQDNIWKISFPKEFDMCIFSNSGGKTNDLTIPGDNQIFDGSGWTAYTE